jgi:uridine kinase
MVKSKSQAGQRCHHGNDETGNTVSQEIVEHHPRFPDHSGLVQDDDGYYNHDNHERRDSARSFKVRTHESVDWDLVGKLAKFESRGSESVMRYSPH